MPKSLQEFVSAHKWAKTRALCKVCKLPESIRAELRKAGQLHIKRAEVFAWLTEECGIKGITADDVKRHRCGRHDAQA